MIMLIAVAAAILFVVDKLGGFSCGGTETAAERFYTPPLPEKGKLSVYCLDVGQGDSFLIVSPDNRSMLIDSGDAVYSRRLIAVLKRLGIESLDTVVCTHPHGDHIGAMAEAVSAFGAKTCCVPAAPFESSALSGVEKALDACGGSMQPLWSGDAFNLGKDVRVAALSPVEGCEYSSTDANDICLILRVEFGETAFLFTADATVHAQLLSMFHNEEYLFRADVLKVPHHGSASSSSLGLFDAAGARIALITCGENNPYGHPDPDTLRALDAAGAEVLRTDKNGFITLISDGRTIDAVTEKQP